MAEHIAGEQLGQIDEAGYCTCPGRIHHSHRNGKKDCRVKLDGAPTVYCVHTSCAGVLEEVNHRLRSRIASAERALERGDSPERPVPSGYEGCAPKPQAAEPGRKVPPFDPAKLALLASQCKREVSLDWIAARSPVPVPSVAEQRAEGRAVGRLFLETLYQPGERVLIFTRFYSQGDFLHVAGGESYRLGDKPGLKAAPSPLPTGAKEGVWFLTAPVTGQWEPIPDPEPRMGRRHEACATRFPYLLLESDTAEESLWVKALVQLPLSIVALYTSGGKSVHALVKVDCDSKADFDACRDIARAVLCPLGADGAAATAIRLSRLPGCQRMGKNEPAGYRRYDQPRLQRLVYLNPAPPRETCLLDLLK
jgi:hypothetical protein